MHHESRLATVCEQLSRASPYMSGHVRKLKIPRHVSESAMARIEAESSRCSDRCCATWWSTADYQNSNNIKTLGESAWTSKSEWTYPGGPWGTPAKPLEAALSITSLFFILWIFSNSTRAGVSPPTIPQNRLHKTLRSPRQIRTPPDSLGPAWSNFAYFQ